MGNDPYAYRYMRLLRSKELWCAYGLTVPGYLLFCISMISCLATINTPHYPYSIAALVAAGVMLGVGILVGTQAGRDQKKYDPISKKKTKLRIIRLRRGRPENVVDYRFGSDTLLDVPGLGFLSPTTANKLEYLAINHSGQLVAYSGYGQPLHRKIL